MDLIKISNLEGKLLRMAEQSGIKRLDFLSKWEEVNIYFSWKEIVVLIKFGKIF